MNSRLRRLLGATVGRLPVTIREGAAKGARWTLFPWTSYWRGSHEPRIQEAICALGDGDIRGWSCWDLGAHFGLYSVALAMKVGKGGQVASFEPNPASYARLERHRRMNRLEWMKIYEAAASENTGSSELLTYGMMDSTTTHLRYEGEADTEACAPIRIRTLRLDDEVAAGILRLPQFVKVDVEGHGHYALRGMAASVARSRPQLIIAFHSEAEVSGVLDVLRPLGYSSQAVAAPRGGGNSMVGGDYLFRPASSAS